MEGGGGMHGGYASPRTTSMKCSLEDFVIINFDINLRMEILYSIFLLKQS